MNGRRTVRWGAGGAALLVVCSLILDPAETSAQSAGTLESAVPAGSTVWITDTAGSERKMRIVSLSDGVIRAYVADELRAVPVIDVRRVRARRSDSLLNGALIGAGSALAAGLYFCTLIESWEICRDDVGPMLRISAVGAGIGIGVDALIRGRKTIYEAGSEAARLRASPMIGRRGAGLQLSLSF